MDSNCCRVRLCRVPACPVSRRIVCGRVMCGRVVSVRVVCGCVASRCVLCAGSRRRSGRRATKTIDGRRVMTAPRHHHQPNPRQNRSTSLPSFTHEPEFYNKSIRNRSNKVRLSGEQYSHSTVILKVLLRLVRT